jgi:hypothetical protein
VFSGGGIHIYWINKDPLTPQEWYPYADGLKQLLLANNIKCDSGLTTDSARILRVPGTLNYKYDPPRPVELAPGPIKLYDFTKKLAFLHQFAGPATAAPPQQGFTLWADGVSGATFVKPSAAFAVLDAKAESLADGIDKFEDHKVDPRPIFTNCRFYRDALKTGGKHYDQPLWMLSVLGTTFMENGNDIAHKISSGHVSYSPVDTQAMYDRKVAERSASGIGYPSCAAIAGAGCKACATCPLFPQGKSPLNIKPPPPKVTAAVTPGVQSTHAIQQCIPEGFDFNGAGIICKVIETTNDDGETTTTMLPVFQSILTDFWLQKNPGEVLNFTTTVDKGFTEPVAVKLGDISTTGFRGLLGHKRVLINPNVTPKILEEFFLSTIGKLRALAAAQQTVPFGWYEEDGKKRGFVYGGKVMLDDGTERACGVADANLQRVYKPHGEMSEWLKAANCIIDRQRPELTSIILTAFAAPLMGLTDQNSLMISACARDSGAGKSASAKIGLSVWGNPTLAKGTASQTQNNITTVMKTIRNLPFFWDEITGPKQLDKICDVMMEADGGKEKGRNVSGSETQAPGEWQLMLSYTANYSLKEHIKTRTSDTTAELMRCFEWEVRKIDGGPGYMSTADADALLARTRHNYGVMGEVYAKYLAMNHVRIQQEVLDKANEVQAKVGSKSDERLWTNGMAMMICAAGYARDCGLNIDPDAIETFMYEVYKLNLADRDVVAMNGNVDNTESHLTRYLKARDAAQRGIWTNYIHNERGKPPKPVKILHGPMTHMNSQGGVEFRFAIENRVLVISEVDFDSWLVALKTSPGYAKKSLEKMFNMKRQYLQMGSGTTHPTGREWCLVLQIAEDSPLYNYMLTWTPPEERPEPSPDAPPTTPAPEEPTVDTGFETDVNGMATPESVIAFVKGATNAA